MTSISLLLVLHVGGNWAALFTVGFDFGTVASGSFGSNQVSATTSGAGNDIIVGPITRGVGLTPLANNSYAAGWGSDAFTNTMTIDDAMANNQFFTFTVSAVAGECQICFVTVNQCAHLVGLSMSPIFITPFMYYNNATDLQGQWQFALSTDPTNFTTIDSQGGLFTYASGTGVASAVSLYPFSAMQQVSPSVDVILRLVNFGANGKRELEERESMKI
jgi:hypothetical protein